MWIKKNIFEVMLLIGIITSVLLFLILFLVLSERLFERTNFYKSRYTDMDKLKGKERVDFVNTGSTFSFYGIDYDACGVNGLNLALRPQALEMDLKMLKHFENRYNRNAIIFIVISDLAFAKRGYDDIGINDRYYKVPGRKEIKPYNLLKVIRAKHFPVLYSWKNFLRFYKDIRPDNEYESRVNENDMEAVEADACMRCRAWLREFGLKDLVDGQQGENFSNVFEYTIGVVADMITWCKKRYYRPVLVNLPVTVELEREFSGEFLDSFYYENIKKAIDKSGYRDVPFIDLQKYDKLSDYLLYIDSCRLNKTGREIITRILLSRTERLK